MDANIFNNWLHMSCFCDDIVEGWVKDRKARNKSVTYDDFEEWIMDDFAPALCCSFEDWMRDEEIEDD